MCTNNDCNLTTLACRCRLPLCQLLQLLFDEGQFVQMQARLLSKAGPPGIPEQKSMVPKITGGNSRDFTTLPLFLDSLASQMTCCAG